MTYKALKKIFVSSTSLLDPYYFFQLNTLCFITDKKQKCDLKASVYNFHHVSYKIVCCSLPNVVSRDHCNPYLLCLSLFAKGQEQHPHFIKKLP